MSVISGAIGTETSSIPKACATWQTPTSEWVSTPGKALLSGVSRHLEADTGADHEEYGAALNNIGLRVCEWATIPMP